MYVYIVVFGDLTFFKFLHTHTYRQTRKDKIIDISLIIDFSVGFLSTKQDLVPIIGISLHNI